MVYSKDRSFVKNHQGIPCLFALLRNLPLVSWNTMSVSEKKVCMLFQFNNAQSWSMWPKSLQPACFSDVQWPYFTPKFSFIAMSSSAKSAMLTAVWFLFQSGMGFWNSCKLVCFWKIEEFVFSVVICNHLCRKQLLVGFHQVTASSSISIKKC